MSPRHGLVDLKWALGRNIECGWLILIHSRFWVLFLPLQYLLLLKQSSWFLP